MSNIIANPIQRNSWSILKVLNQSRYCTQPTYIYKKREDDYNSVVKYPPIEKLDERTQKQKEDQKFYDLIKRQNTIEEKAIAINYPRYWGWKCFIVEEGTVPFNGLDFMKHLTRTHLIKIDHLPNYYDKLNKKAANISKQVKENIEDSIAYQLSIRHKKSNIELSPLEQEKEVTEIIIYELNKTILNNLSTDEWHLKNIQVDYAPRIESFWQNKSIKETFVKKQNKDGIPIERVPEEYEDRPSDKYFQYIGRPILQLRHNEPLCPLMDVKDAHIYEYAVPEYKYDPHNLGFEIRRRFGTNIPGFWPGEKKDFNFLSYHDSNHSKHRLSTYDDLDAEETIQWQAISASFGWLMAIANYQGFSTYHDVTYPLVNQAVLTNGKEFTFSVYQLNTTAIYSEDFFKNPKCNCCWITPSQKLFESFENGKLQGFNEDVLKNLITLYINEPKAKEGVNLKPYLGKNEKVAADYEDIVKAEWLERQHKHIQSNRPRHKKDQMYQVYDYERIFVIEHQTKPARKKWRPFDFGEQPYWKPLDWKPDIIPRKQRVNPILGPKYRPTFYPK